MNRQLNGQLRGQLRTRLAALPARQLRLLAFGVVAIVAAAAWSLLLRAPLAAWRQHAQVLATLQQAGADGAGAPPAALPATAPATAPAAAPPQPLALVGAVSRSAAAAGVTIASAAQGAERTLAGLRMRTIDVAASGSYPAILAWLAAIEADQPAIGIVRLELQQHDTGAATAVTLQLAIYDTGTPP